MGWIMQKFEIPINLWFQEAVESSVKRGVTAKIRRHPKFAGIEPEWVNLTVVAGIIEVSWAFKEYTHQFDHDWIVGTECIPIAQAVKDFLAEPSYGYL